ncbi:ACID PHOSPHATASE/VANADIUM-DEPENDENT HALOPEROXIDASE-RELATED PROTEIN [Salix viminalis]|uniref:ACID PHOSPHATASE/VANADIUM-DEPENDENT HALOPEROXIDASE-RELATED PROTEIN n=1 Tax=Salix viminalis TaxID=40686 RepID=A0A9Q0TZL4_SALVM|nr:ACID PHOSPHATASE/VANADIUM-DEPENDENT HALOPEROXIDASE-RELATED PROTEIN [Salix viminalis]
MVLQCWSSAPNLTNPYLSTLFLHSKPYNFPRFRKPRKPATLTCILKLGVEDIAEIASNKVVIAAVVSAAIGQLSKPYTCVLLYGRDFDFRTTFQAGGFPSTHSSSVVAAATSLALERGFSDSIFGLAVVYACLVMYDAQGVRREVGNHAKALNKMLPKTEVNSMVCSRDDLIGSKEGPEENLGALLSKEERPFLSDSTNPPVLLETENKTRQSSQRLAFSSLKASEEATEKIPSSSAPLKESIGHTEFEVIAGALLGFFVSVAVHTIL